MVERKRIGLKFSYNENWIAGTYYILNIIHALNTLNDNEKPIVVILTEKEENFHIVKKETNYPYLAYFEFPSAAPKYGLLERILNKGSRMISGKNIIIKKPDQPDIQFLFPKQIRDEISESLKKIHWIPDFQEEHLPEYFSKEEITERKDFQKEMTATGDVVVLSSEDAKSDFLRLYPEAHAETFVLPFAVSHPDFSDQNIEELRSKYELPQLYFFVPNQFWAHKNHMLVLKAVRILKERNVDIRIAMTGKQNDYRNADNFKNIKSYVKEHDLDNYLRFLGFISREEQLCLMKHARAIIQPSLFEGWSTVVEDAKLLNVFLILSQLNVHKEQIQENAHFFDPYNENELASVLEKYANTKPQLTNKSYKDNVIQFGKRFMTLVHKVT
ncbi:MAG: glycosyltransferase family 4 protein [Saprospiraceae bacterium]|nr:glycosyltransferase family 4 protein [Saprospiraceae bacterium]